MFPLHKPPQVQQMGQYFGIKPDEEKYIWEVAEMGLCAPLPPGWKEEVTQEPGEPAPGIAFRYATQIHSHLVVMYATTAHSWCGSA
jgi:hypothetical protein